MRALLLAFALAACQRTVTVPIFGGADPNDLVIAAVESSQGELTQIEWFRAQDEAPVLERADDDRVHFFSLAEGDLVTAMGQTFRTGLGSLLLVYDVENRPPALQFNCGRCLSTTAEPPQFFREGDECAVPENAEYESLNGGDRAAIAERLRIGFGARCSCRPYLELAGEASIRFELVDERADAWPYESIAATASGAIALFGEHRSLLIRPSGNRVLRQEDQLPFRGRVISSAASSRDTYFTISFEGNERKIHVLDDQLDMLAELSLGLVASRVVSFRDAGVMVLGEQPGEEPTALLCTAVSPFDCRPIWSAPFGAIGRTLIDAVLMRDGSLVLASLHGLVVLERLPLDPREPVASRALRPDVEGIDETQSHYTFAGRAGDWLLVCIQDVQGAAVVGARIDRGTVTSTEAPELVLLDRGSSCRPFSSVVGESESARIVYHAGDHAVIDASGPAPVVRDASPAYRPLGAEVPVSGVETFHDGVTIAWTGSDARHSVWVREGSTFRLKYGEPEEVSPVVAMVKGPDRVIAMRADGRGEAIRQDSSRETIRILGLPGSVTRVAVDSFFFDLVVAGYDGARAFIGHVPFEGGPIALITEPIPGDTQVHRIEEVVPGVFVIVTTDERLFLMRNDLTESLQPTWDDPSTEGEEREVDPSCGMRFRDVSASDGRAYLVGCGPTLMEIDPRARTAHRIAGRIRDEASELPILSAVGAICTDSVIFGSVGFTNTELERGLFWELGPGTECEAPYFGRCLRQIDRVQSPGRYSSGLPAAIASVDDRSIAVFHSGGHGGGSVQQLGGEGRFRYPEAITLATGTPWNTFVVATAFGQLLVWR